MTVSRSNYIINILWFDFTDHHWLMSSSETEFGTSFSKRQKSLCPFISYKSFTRYAILRYISENFNTTQPTWSFRDVSSTVVVIWCLVFFSIIISTVDIVQIIVFIYCRNDFNSVQLIKLSSQIKLRFQLYSY